jgi:hypothetical protein
MAEGVRGGELFVLLMQITDDAETQHAIRKPPLQ